MAEDAWNMTDRGAGLHRRHTLAQPRGVPLFVGRAQVHGFLVRKWARELDYRLIKELWAFSGERIAVRFAYEWHDDSGQWYRSYGNENWAFTPCVSWPIGTPASTTCRLPKRSPLPLAPGRRPDEHPD
ncbi:MAG: DUF1348 family protein [Burkholderiaceae bacterium]